MKTNYVVESIANPGCYWVAGGWCQGNYGHVYTSRKAAENAARVKDGTGRIVEVLNQPHHPIVRK